MPGAVPLDFDFPERIAITDGEYDARCGLHVGRLRRHGLIQDFLFGFLASSDYTSNRFHWSRFSHFFHPERLRHAQPPCASGPVDGRGAVLVLLVMLWLMNKQAAIRPSDARLQGFLG